MGIISPEHSQEVAQRGQSWHTVLFFFGTTEELFGSLIYGTLNGKSRYLKYEIKVSGFAYHGFFHTSSPIP